MTFVRTYKDRNSNISVKSSRASHNPIREGLKVVERSNSFVKFWHEKWKDDSWLFCIWNDVLCTHLFLVRPACFCWRISLTTPVIFQSSGHICHYWFFISYLWFSCIGVIKLDFILDCVCLSVTVDGCLW